jgi:hypothetical protein
MREAEDLIRREQLFVYLCICVFVWPRFQKKHRKKTNTQKTPSDGTVRQGSFVYLFICVFNNKITALRLWYKKYTNLQISVFRLCECFFSSTPSLVYLFCPKSGFVGEFTNTHYKMTRILPYNTRPYCHAAMWIARKPAPMYEQFSQFAPCSYVCGQFEWHIRFPIFNMIPTIC